MEFDLLSSLKVYKPFDKQEGEYVKTIIDFLEHGENQFVRTNLERHIVASGYLLSADLKRILLTHHKALSIWLPFGGHSDGESNSVSVAKREVAEESGITNIDICGGQIFDVDIHTIPENKAKHEPEHKHMDIRFLFTTTEKNFTVSDESDSLGWFEIPEFEEMIRNSDYFSGTERVIAKLEKFIKERKKHEEK